MASQFIGHSERNRTITQSGGIGIEETIARKKGEKERSYRRERNQDAKFNASKRGEVVNARKAERAKGRKVKTRKEPW